MLQRFFQSNKDPKRRAILDLASTIDDLRTYWPDDAGQAESDFLIHANLIVKGDRTIFTFGKTLDALHAMSARMVKPIFATHDPIVVGIAHAGLLALGEIAPEIRKEVSLTEKITETKKLLSDEVRDIRSETSIYLMFYGLVKRAGCTRFLSKNREFDHLCKSLRKILSNNYDEKDIDHAFESAETLLTKEATHADKPSFQATAVLRMAYAVLPILQFIKKAGPHLIDRWMTLKSKIQPMLKKLKRFNPEEFIDSQFYFSPSSMSSALVTST